MRNCISSGDKWQQSAKAILVDDAAYLQIKGAHLLHVFVLPTVENRGSLFSQTEPKWILNYITVQIELH